MERVVIFGVVGIQSLFISVLTMKMLVSCVLVSVDFMTDVAAKYLNYLSLQTAMNVRIFHVTLMHLA